MGLKESGLRGSLRNVSVGISAIPDTSVSRPDDDDAVETPNEEGIRMETNVVWPEIDCRLSNLVENQTRCQVFRAVENDDDVLIGEEDISSINALDIFTVDLTEDIVSDEEYEFIVGAEGSEYTLGRLEDPDYPYVSDDGDISLIGGAKGSGRASNILEIGNLR